MTMDTRHIQAFYDYLSSAVTLRTRLALLAVSIPLLLSFWFPLWRIEMFAPQYPNGLSLDIYSYQLVPGHGGSDLREINILNHYIGMRHISRAELRDLDWMPFALGGLLLLALRVAAIGTVRSLIDLVVVSGYISLFAFSRFVYTLYSFGHDLDPKAPIKVEPFMPPVIGSKKIANFTSYSFPSLGSILIGVFVAGICTTLALELRRGYVASRARGAAASSGEGVEQHASRAV